MKYGVSEPPGACTLYEINSMFQPGASERQPGPSAQLAKTGTLQQSENYIWNTADVLGRGATAVVYFGRHKVT